ncbi:hypothetical protein, partial [Pseudomonas aeruginosa]|uniref:hypothetical protein n=1 Tax=Pseudomonas aeruginosa TaxID=287 RepID=UPI0024B6FA60
MHQRGRPYGDPALPFRAFRGAAGEDQPGQRRDNRQAGGTAKRTEGERWVAVRAAPLVHQIGLVGRLEPGRVV